MSQKSLCSGILFSIGLVLVPFRTVSQPVDHFEVTFAAGTVTNGVPFAVVITAIGPDGTVVTNAQDVVGLSAFKPGPGMPVITEVFKTGGTIELANPGTQPLDLSDWELEALADYPYYGASPTTPNARLRFPPGTVMPPQSVLTWSDRGVPPGAYPAFVSSKPFSSGSGFYIVRLLSAEGEARDEVYMHSAVSAADNALWKGVGLGLCPTNFSYMRTGFANHFRNLDWTTNAPTLGTNNPALQIPWTNTGTYYSPAPGTVPLSNGTWTGSIVFSNVPPGTVWLKADNGAGVSGTAPPVTVLDGPKLSLVVPPAVSIASESQAGFVGYVTVLRSEGAVSDLPVSLSLSDTNEFIVPAQVTIPAGTNAVLVAVTNVDDSIADGDAVVTLTATAPDYAAASATLVNSDAEVGTLFVVLPGSLAEDCGFEADPGQVFLSEPARHDVLVRLTAEPPIEVPAPIIIPKGELSQSFRLRVGADGLVNPSPWLVHVRAQTGNWPWADGVVTLTDKDDGSFMVLLPPTVVEGMAASGQIQVKTPHQIDTTFALTSKNSRLQVPAQVTLPAGALTVSFSLQVTNNFVADPQIQVQVCAQTAGRPSVCNVLTVVDDEVDISALTSGPTPKAVFSNEPFTLSAVLGNSSGQPQLTNTVGQLDVLADSSVARLDPNPNPLLFTNGVWSNQIVLVGEALGLQLQVSAAGFQTTTPRLDLLTGLDVPIGLTDAVWDQSSGKFLVAEAVQTNAPARLTEIDPWTGARGRGLDLPRQVQRIALSDDGQVVWLASTSNTLQRVDLAAWQFNREYSIDPATANAYASELLVLSGEVDRLLAITSTNRASWRAVLYDHGLPLTNRVTLPGTTSAAAALAAGRAGEAFCQSAYYLSHLLIVSNGVALDRSVSISSSAAASLTFSGSNVFRGTGEVFIPDTLATAPPFATQSSLLGIPCPDWSAALFIEQNGLKAYDLNTRQTLGFHAVPNSVSTASRMLRWSPRGFATFSASAKVLSIFQTPLLTTNLPDLVVTASAPAIATVPPNGLPVTFSWQFCITNHGTSPAFGVQLRTDSGNSYILGTLAPGQGVSVTEQHGSYYVGIFHATATALCVVADANPADNVVTVVTRVQKQDMPPTRQLILGMTHLIASPAGDRLYVSVATSAGDVQDGVAVVNPETGTIEQMLPVGTDPQHLAISADGSDLYVLLGTNRLIRWNLPANSNALSLTFTNDAVLDFTPNPASPRSVVVSTKAHVAVFDEAQIRPATFESPIDRRYLGYAGGSLWAAEPGYLRAFTISAGGLVTGTNMPFTLFSDFYQFASDGRHLFFSGAIVDTLTGAQLSTFLGDHFAVDLPNNSVFTAVGGYLRRYSLSDYAYLGEQWLSQAADTYQTDPVRWGDSGVAMRSGLQLLMVRSALVPATNLVDLGVSVSAPTVAFPYQTMEWSVVLTNKSDQIAPCTMLTVTWGDLHDLQIDGPYSYQAYSTMLYDAGAMPAHSAVSFKIRGWTWTFGTSTMTASIQTAATDTYPGDNTASASVWVDNPAADLGVVSVSAPGRVQSGDEFEATFVFTNAGPSAASTTLLSLTPCAGLQFLGVKGDTFPTNDWGVLLGAVGAEESRTVVLRYKAAAAGLLQVSANAQGEVADPQSSNDRGAVWVYAAPLASNDAVTELTFPGAIMAWDRSRQQVIASFPDAAWSVMVLDPVRLEPVREIALPWLPDGIAPCIDGRHAWISLAGSGAVRVDLTTGALEHQFVYDAAQSSDYGIAAPPGQSNLVVAGFDPGFLGNNQFRVFDNGNPRPAGYWPGGWSGGGTPMVFAPDGRLYLASSMILRQLRITATGLAEVRNLDSAGLYSGLGLSYASNRLFFSEGRIVNLNTGAVDDTLLDIAPLAADDETGFAYEASGQWGGLPMIIRRMDAVSLKMQWRQVLDAPSSTVNAILPIGTNGCLIIGDKIRLLNPGRIGSPAVDLAIAFSPLPGLSDVTVPLPVQLTVTNRSPWAAQQTTLSLQLPSGLVFAPDSPGAGGTTAKVDLGTFYGATNIGFLVLPLTNGIFAIHASVTNDLPDLVPSDNQQELVASIAPAPVFFFDDSGILEGSAMRPGRLTGWLSRPPLINVSASFTITPLTAQSNDFSALAGVFQFAPGQTCATCSVIVADSTPEPDESALLAFSSTNLVLAQPTALLTIVNDDFPQVSVANVTLADGASGYTNANFQVSLSAAAPFPVDVAFQVVPGSAIPGTDYLPRQGWLHFAPGETLKTVPVPVVGDRGYKPNKTAYFNLQQAVGATFGSAQGLLTILNDDLPAAPQITINLVPGGLSIDFNSVLGATYQLQNRTNFTTDPWHTLSGSLQGTGGPIGFALPAPSQRTVFYRVAGR